MRHGARALAGLWVAWAAAGCGGDGTKRAETPDAAALLDPETCKTCHAEQHREWSGSMHAYAADDPVFLAMNRRGQRETNGALGDFCVKCHAPMAVEMGLTKDGLNLAELPQKVKGVTCTFCHSRQDVQGTHNNPLTPGPNPRLLYGPFADPAANQAHESTYSQMFDLEHRRSAAFCGSCHDIVNGHGTHLERTFAEWEGTVFSRPPIGQSCISCHMDVRKGKAGGDVVRDLHSHTFAGVDLAMTPWPERDTQRALVQSALDDSLQGAICVTRSSLDVEVHLENVGVGHNWPSGATADRRAWVEVRAFAGDREIFSSGVVADEAKVEELPDPNLWLIRDCLFGETGKPVHMFWEAASFASNQLLAATTSNPADPAYYRTHFKRRYTMPEVPDRITMRVRLRALGDDVLDDLVASGDLEPGLRAEVPTFDLGGTGVTWNTKTAKPRFTDSRGRVYLCETASSSFAPTEHVAVSHARCEK